MIIKDYRYYFWLCCRESLGWISLSRTAPFKVTVPDIDPLWWGMIKERNRLERSSRQGTS